jgi:hypothetical protein
MDDEQLDAYQNLGINRKELEKYASLPKPIIRKNIKYNSSDKEEIKKNTKKYDNYGNPRSNKFNNREDQKM